MIICAKAEVRQNWFYMILTLKHIISIGSILYSNLFLNFQYVKYLKSDI